MAGNVTSEQLRAAFKARGLFYLAIYREMAQEIGAEKAAAIMRRAIYKRGVEIGATFSKYAPSDMQGLCKAFLDFIPDSKNLFDPELVRCDASEIDIKFHTCPLKEAWQEAGLSPQEMAHMCSIAGVVDNGTFEGAGFAFHSDTWHEGEDGCCHLHIRPGPPKKG